VKGILPFIPVVGVCNSFPGFHDSVFEQETPDRRSGSAKRRPARRRGSTRPPAQEGAKTAPTPASVLHLGPGARAESHPSARRGPAPRPRHGRRRGRPGTGPGRRGQGTPGCPGGGGRAWKLQGGGGRGVIPLVPCAPKEDTPVLLLRGKTKEFPTERKKSKHFFKVSGGEEKDHQEHQNIHSRRKNVPVGPHTPQTQTYKTPSSRYQRAGRVFMAIDVHSPDPGTEGVGEEEGARPPSVFQTAAPWGGVFGTTARCVLSPSCRDFPRRGG